MSNSLTHDAVLNGEQAQLPNGTRHINLTLDERTALANRLELESAVAMFLDLTQDHTWPEIADSLGISVSKLKRLTSTAEFQAIYGDALATVGHDPRLMAVKSSLGDLLPAAYRRLQKIVSNDGDDRTALRAIEKLFQWTGVDANVPQDDPQMYANFLKRFGVNVEGNLNVLNVVVPPEYQAAYARFLSPQRTDTDVPEDHAAGSEVLDAVTVEEAPAPSPVPELPDQTAEAGSDPASPPEDAADAPIQ